MKATFKSMMVIGMMILGTATSFANSNASADKYHNVPRQECHLRHIHDSRCGGAPVVDKAKIYPGMDKKLRKHLLKGDHKFNRYGVCKNCNMNIREINHIERGLGMHNASVHAHRR